MNSILFITLAWSIIGGAFFVGYAQARAKMDASYTKRDFIVNLICGPATWIMMIILVSMIWASDVAKWADKK